MSSRTSPPDHCLWCHGAAAPVQEVLRAILANRGFLVQFKEGPSYGGWPRLQEDIVFSCMGDSGPLSSRPTLFRCNAAGRSGW